MDKKSILSHKQITIQTTPTSSDLDAGQELIKQYLLDRCAEKGTHDLALEDDSVLIDIGVLGVYRESFKAIRDWRHDSVYPLRLYHAAVLLGPLYTRGKGRNPCPLCLERRWLALRPREEQESLDNLQEALIFGANPRLLPSTLEWIWTIVEEVLYQEKGPKRSADQASVYVLNLDSLSL